MSEVIVQFKSWKQRALDRGTSVSTEKRCYAADPKYPRLVSLSPGRVAFVASELDEYDATLIASRDAVARRDPGEPETAHGTAPR